MHSSPKIMKHIVACLTAICPSLESIVRGSKTRYEEVSAIYNNDGSVIISATIDGRTVTYGSPRKKSCAGKQETQGHQLCISDLANSESILIHYDDEDRILFVTAGYGERHENEFKLIMVGKRPYSHSGKPKIKMGLRAAARYYKALFLQERLRLDADTHIKNAGDPVIARRLIESGAVMDEKGIYRMAAQELVEYRNSTLCLEGTLVKRDRDLEVTLAGLGLRQVPMDLPLEEHPTAAKYKFVGEGRNRMPSFAIRIVQFPDWYMVWGSLEPYGKGAFNREFDDKEEIEMGESKDKGKHQLYKWISDYMRVLQGV